MSDLYVYRKHVRRHWYRKFTLRRRYVIFFALLILAVSAFILVDSIRSDKSKRPTSAAQQVEVGDKLNTFHSEYFKFQDTGNWVLFRQESTNQKYVYFKYKGVQPIGRLTVYVNEMPPQMDLAVSRVLPVRIVNQNRFNTTAVYGPCGSKYAPGELRKVKELVIEGASVLCDPDTPLYQVVLSEVNGYWQLPMERANGEPIKFVITYRDIRLDPGPVSILRIASSFKSL